MIEQSAQVAPSRYSTEKVTLNCIEQLRELHYLGDEYDPTTRDILTKKTIAEMILLEDQNPEIGRYLLRCIQDTAWGVARGAYTGPQAIVYIKEMKGNTR